MRAAAWAMCVLLLALASATVLASASRSAPASTVTPLTSSSPPSTAASSPPAPCPKTRAAAVAAAAAAPSSPAAPTPVVAPKPTRKKIVVRKKCAYPCANGGRCVDGRCKCKLGFVGLDCSRLGCASNCNQRGYCDLASSPPACLCFPGWTGFDCEFSDAPEAQRPKAPKAPKANATEQSDADAELPARVPLDRTLCNPPCDAAHGVCWQGSCACADGFAGETCNELLCPDDCSGHGKCNRRTGECACYRPYIGRTCARSTERVLPRRLDTMEHVYGPHQLPLNRPASEQLNQHNPHKRGLSDTLHLVEQHSAVRITAGDLVGPQ